MRTNEFIEMENLNDSSIYITTINKLDFLGTGIGLGDLVESSKSATAQRIPQSEESV